MNSKLRILVVGSGGREHAIVDTLAQSRRVEKLWCAPGNPGMRGAADCVAIKADDLPALEAFARANRADLTVVGPEGPLVLGLADRFHREGLAVVGPTKAAARLEGSKSFAKSFMRKYGIPTARYEILPNLEKGAYVLSHWKGRCVLKADGLAAGKGVKVCETIPEAKEFLYELMEKEIFGSAGSTAVLEECLEGQEATVMAFCDGETLLPLPASQDHKRVMDQDQGPNTGGMGAYAPAPLMTPDLLAQIDEAIFRPFIAGLKGEKFDYRGVIYFGLMTTPKGPRVLEFNVRLGDPETQAVLPLLDSDLADIFHAVAERRLSQVEVRWKKASALSVVLASGGYPGPFATGKPIEGLQEARKQAGIKVYCAGVEVRNNQWVTAGGRVLAVTGIAASLGLAKDRAYGAVSKIAFEGMHYRRDIGAKALEAVVS